MSVRGGTQAIPAVRVRTTRVPKLVAVAGPASGRAFAFTRSVATVGRHPTNDFAVEDPRVSGVHLELSRVDDRLRLVDMGSMNGTWLGPHRVREVELVVGAEFTIGDTTIRVDADDSAPESEVAPSESFGGLVGRTPPMRELFQALERISPKELTVLIQGETGTGKEEVARAIHLASPRASGPFIVIDATALPETLAESLLFGHEKGAFTGANERRNGFFEAARGGTVFIDEVGELPAALQAKFLRVLERREVIRVGGHSPSPIDVRVLSATNRDLRNAIDRGNFREDLYYRLAQVRVVVPPVRARIADVPLLAQKLLTRAGSTALIDVDALEHLQSKPWPGNVRELNNVLLRAAALAQDGVIRRSDVAGEGDGFRGTKEERSALDLSGTFGEAKDRAIERFERAYLAMLMKRCGGNLSAAARQAEVARHHLRDLLKKRGLYGVSLDDE
jgi:DNA-binding NtrC family response regulator